MKDYEYDVCLSFAGAQRPFVEQVADILRDRGVRVFYDDHEKSRLWGKDLYVHLDFVYRQAARYCIAFVSAEYAEGMWTNHERGSIYARVLADEETYLLPARFDETELPGLPDTIAYMDLREMAPADLASHLVEKLDLDVRTTFHYLWPSAYGGPVWVRIRPTPVLEGKVHAIGLHWGPWRRDVELEISGGGLTLVMTKAQEEVAVPLAVKVRPPALVTFGSRQPIGPALNIDNDWYPHAPEFDQ